MFSKADCFDFFMRPTAVPKFSSLTDRISFTTLSELDGQVYSFCINQKDQSVIVLTFDSVIKIYDMQDWKLLNEFPLGIDKYKVHEMFYNQFSDELYFLIRKGDGRCLVSFALSAIHKRNEFNFDGYRGLSCCLDEERNVTYLIGYQSRYYKLLEFDNVKRTLKIIKHLSPDSEDRDCLNGYVRGTISNSLDNSSIVVLDSCFNVITIPKNGNSETIVNCIPTIHSPPLNNSFSYSPKNLTIDRQDGTVYINFSLEYPDMSTSSARGYSFFTHVIEPTNNHCTIQSITSSEMTHCYRNGKSCLLIRNPSSISFISKN